MWDPTSGVGCRLCGGDIRSCRGLNDERSGARRDVGGVRSFEGLKRNEASKVKRNERHANRDEDVSALATRMRSALATRTALAPRRD